MRGPRNHAIERNILAKKAKPIGQFIVDRLHAKTTNSLYIPPPPKIGVQQGDGQVVAGQRPRKTFDREASVLHTALRWLHTHGVFAWRNNTGTAWLQDRPLSYGYPGSSDIIGILPDGRFLAIECKSATGKQSAKQKTFQVKIEANHGVYLLIRSVEELEQIWVRFS